MSVTPNPVCEKYGPGAAVGVDLRCPRHEHRDRVIHGSAEVVNEYGVRDPLPKRCRQIMWTGRPCGWLLDVVLIVDVEDPPGWGADRRCPESCG